MNRTEHAFYWLALSANALGVLFNTATHNWSSAALCAGMLILVAQNPPSVIEGTSDTQEGSA